jgi:methanogenic corrinoid protein MtbC1
VQKVRRLLASAVERLDEDRVLHIFKLGLEQGIDPIDLIEDVRNGMERVGVSYGRKNYYIADLIMASMIFKDVLELVPIANDTIQHNRCSVLFGTAEKDIHDIGKNITIGLLKSRGIRVLDLGVNVKPEQFVASLQQTSAPILAMSGLLTVSYASMRETVQFIDVAGLRNKVTIMIGGIVNEKVNNYVGSDYWCKDSTQGVRICESILGLGGNAHLPQEITDKHNRHCL